MMQIQSAKNMGAWYAPATFGLWIRRLMAPRSVVMILILAALAATELRFDWMEKIAGVYLVSTNHLRPQSGAIWEQGRQTDLARKTLATYTSERQTTQREARRATSLGQVVATIDSDRGAMISAKHFVELYLKLPPVLSHEIVSPYTMLTHLSSGLWQRTFFERQDRQLLVYLLDTQNEVLLRLSVGAGLLSHIERGEVAIQSGLDQLSDFADHIYPAEDFFSALSTLSATVRQGVIAHPEDLLRTSGRIRRVGVSRAAFAGVVDIGFEVETLDGAKVILMQAEPDDVERLQRLLNGQSRFDEDDTTGGAP